MNLSSMLRFFLPATLMLAAISASAQEPAENVPAAPPDHAGAIVPLSAGLSTGGETAANFAEPSAPSAARLSIAGMPSAAPVGSPPRSGLDAPQRLGPLTLSVSWRFRSESWDSFQPASGQNAYTFQHSLLRVGIGQKTDSYEWLIEGAQDAIVDLPSNAVVAGTPGQLGVGGTYFAANGNAENNVNGFLKQVYAGFAFPTRGNLRLGRFTFLDGAEAVPKDPTLAALVRTRITQRLIGDFGFSAVQRSFDGARLSLDTAGGNLTFFGARPTRGVYQSDGLGELSIDLFYGAYTRPLELAHGEGELRVFSAGYIDERGAVLKTDNRPIAVRSADKDQIRIGTYGADYVHVFHAARQGQFDFLVWGALQNGSWGTQTQRAGAFVGEAGWQPAIRILNPWFSVGYSYGSGDSNPHDATHGTFFQILPTPRPYARFPFYNMENNEDYYGTAVFRFPHSFVVRSEAHALRLASAQDLWYLGGGAFQPKTFGYSGRVTKGQGSLANTWDASLDVPLRRDFSVTLYYGHAWGKAAIASIYPDGTNAQFGYIETNFRF